MDAPPGLFVISLDFELHWGVCDTRTVDDYRENLLGVRDAVPAMLALFERHGIHATWATVGFLFFDRREALLAAVPSHLPTYAVPGLSCYDILDTVGDDEATDPYHFGRGLLEQIRATPHQEIATHTFSHYYCLERGQTIDQFRADLRAAREAARTLGVELTSIVFPRNQVSLPHLAVCAEFGIHTYRGNEGSWYHRPAIREGVNLHRRAMRLIDTYLNVGGRHAVARSEVVERDFVNVRASQFLRPYSRRLRHLEPLKRRRITSAMTHAAKRGLIYHLWWHPHNFGRYLDENLQGLTAILEHFSLLAARHGMRSVSMSEIASEMRAPAGRQASNVGLPAGGWSLAEPSSDSAPA